MHIIKSREMGLVENQVVMNESTGQMTRTMGFPKQHLKQNRKRVEDFGQRLNKTMIMTKLNRAMA